MLRTASTVTFACYSKVCAPPPAGKGGSVKGGASTTSAAGIKRMYSGFEHNGVRIRSVEVGPSRAGERKTVLTFVDGRNREVGRAIHYFNENRPDEVHHDTLLFKSSERGKGLGAAFLRHCVEQYRSAGVKKVTLWAASTPGSSGLVGAAVWGKLGFDFHGRKQKDLADAMEQYNEARGFGEPETFSKSLRRAVSRGTASIKDVMKADPGDFLNSESGIEVNWDGTLLLDEVTLTAAAALTLSYAEWADAEERYLRSRSSTSAGSLVAACYSAACAPPSAGGTGGSLPRGSAAAAAAQAARAAGGAKAVKPAKPKGGSERTVGLGVPVHNVTEFTRKIAAAIAAEPALQGMKSMKQRKDEVEAEYQQAVDKHESEWRRKLREGTDPADIGLRVRTSVWVAGSQFPKSERDAVERSMHEAMVKILDDPSFVPQTEIEKAAFRIMKMRLEKNGGRTPYVSTNFQYILSDGTKVDMDAAHFVDSYPVKKKPSLDDPAITPEFEAATRRIGGMVREEIVARTQRLIDATPQPDWDAIEAEKQRQWDAGDEVLWTLVDGKPRVVKPGVSYEQSNTYPAVAALNKMIEESGMLSADRQRHDSLVRSQANRKALEEVLSEIRPIGGRFDGTPNHRTPPHYAWSDHRSSHEQVMLATRYIPSDWIDISNARGPVNFKSTQGRARYKDWISEITLSGKTSVALHELMHRAEYTVPGLAQLERVFLSRRAAGETPTRLNKLVPKSTYDDDEVATPDQLFDPYAGKVYTDGAREVMSMGMQYLLEQGIGRVGSGTAPDADYADLVFGALSVLGRNT